MTKQKTMEKNSETNVKGEGGKQRGTNQAEKANIARKKEHEENG